MKEYRVRTTRALRTGQAFFLVLFVSSAACAQQELRRFEVGAQFSLLSLRRPNQIFTNSSVVGALGVTAGVGSRTEPGFGGRFTYNATDNLAFEAEGNLFPRNEAGYRFTEDPSSSIAFNPGMPAGRIFQGQFGAKAGKRFRKIGIFGKARPGFIGFTEVSTLLKSRIINNPPPTPPFTVGDFAFQKKMYLSVDLGAVIEYYAASRVFVRFDLGDTIIRYGTYREPGAFFSRNIIERSPETKHNLQFTAGFGFRL